MGTSYAEAGRLRAGRDDAVAEAAVLAAKLEAAEDMLRHAMGAGDADWDGWLMAHDGLCDWYRGARAGADGAARAALDARLRDEEASREHWQRVASWHAAKVRELAEENEALREWRACYEIARAELDELYEARGLPGGVEWPRFEDGEPVGIGDRMMYDGRPERVQGIRFYDTAVVFEFTGVDHCRTTYGFAHGQPVDRAPILASDGHPIEVGQTLYGESDGFGWKVESIDWANRKYPVLAVQVSGGDVFAEKRLRPEWLSHDSLKLVATEVRSAAWNKGTEDCAGVTAGWLEGIAERIGKLAGEGAR